MIRLVIIGFAGLARSGKSECADRLVKKHGFARAAFARPLKDMLAVLLRYRGCTSALVERMLYGDLKETPTDWLNGKSPREALQTLGTEWGRDLISADLWVDSFSDHMRRLGAGNAGRLYVLEDVRFANEVFAIHALGGSVARVERAGAGSASGGGHVSEQLAFEPDMVIDNNGTLAQLRARVDEIVEEVTRPQKAMPSLLVP